MTFRDRIHHSIYQTRDQPFPYPDLPPSLTPHRAVNDEEPPVVHTVLPYNTPYLGLRARLSQVWLNRWTVLLMLIVVRVILFVVSMDDDLDSAKVRALSACTGVESMGSAMASMPHYMATGVNEAAAKGIEAAVHGLQKMLTMSITVIEAIVIFAINVVVQTYVCLLTFAIRSSLGTVINAASEITDFLNKTLTEAISDIQDDAKSFEDSLNKMLEGINSVGNFFGSDSSIPKLELPSLDRLKGIQIPHKVQDGLDTLNNSIPTFDQVNTMYNSILRLPFSYIQKEINDSLTVYEFDRKVLPIPEKETLTFCSESQAINNFFSGIHEMIFKVRNIILGVLIALAVLVIIPMAYREWWRYRSMRQRAYMLTAPGQSFDPVDIVQISSRPYSSTIGLKAAAMFKSTRRQILVRWFFAYISTPTAMFVLSLGLAGLLSSLGQYIVLKQVVAATPELADQVGDFADLVVNKLTDASLAWANDANGVIVANELKINDDVLGWVHNGSSVLNNTLTEFVDTMTDGIKEVFEGTPLEEPIQNIFFCLIELKVKGIQSGLTWINEHSQVAFPKFPNDTFSLGAATSIGPDATSGSASFLADTGSEAADKITDVVVKLSDSWERHLLVETYISSALVGIWVFIVLIGLLRVIFLMLGRDKTRAEGGGRGLTGDGRQTFSDKTEERNGSPVFPQFNEKSETSLHRRYEGDADDIPATIGSPSRSGYTRERGQAWTKSHYGEISH